MNNDMSVTIGIDVDTTGVEEGLKEAEEKAKAAGAKAGGGFSSVFSKVANKLKDTLTGAFSKMAGVSKKLLNAVTGVVGVVAKIGLGFGAIGAIAFGLISAVVILAKAFEKVFEENEQIKADFQYIAFAIGKALEPAINAVANALVKIVNWLIQIIKYTMLFINLWAGRNVFGGASAEAFAKHMATANKNTKAIAKNLKEASKQLTGFDEMNVLSSNTAGSSGGGATGGGGITMPSFDLGDLGGMETPQWMQDIVKYKDIILETLAGIITALIAIKLGMEAIKAVGLGIVIITLIGFIKSVIDYLNEPTWENFGHMVGWLTALVVALAVVFGGIPALITAIIGLIVALGVALYKNWDKVKETFNNAIKWIKEKIIDPVAKWFKDVGEGIAKRFNDAVTSIKTKWQGLKDWFSNLIAKIKDKFKEFGSKIGDTVGGAFKAVINWVLEKTENILNAPIRTINKLLDKINEVPGIDITRLNTITLPRLARGGIVNNPGPGVMMGNYIAGENGAEAVLPLTDDTLQRLANMIPITVNLTNTMNGRVISRELQKVQNSSDFAYNR